MLVSSRFGMATIKQTNLYLRLSSLLGLLLSCYALFVEIKKEEDKEYEAYCDIAEYISCSKAFSSEYGKGFGIVAKILGEDSLLNQPNSVAGIIFYLLLIFMSFSDKKIIIRLQTFLCALSNLMTLYLAYILYFVLHDLCVVCAGTYIVNAINLVLSIYKWDFINKASAKRKLSKKSH